MEERERKKERERERERVREREYVVEATTVQSTLFVWDRCAVVGCVGSNIYFLLSTFEL